MTAPIFRVRPQSRQCQEAICLEDYETAWRQHQQIQFRRTGEGGGFEKFRARVWGNASYAEGMWIRISGPQGQKLSWADVASNGRIEFSDIQSLMEVGLVEFLAPSHRCLTSRVPTQWIAWPIRSSSDFRTMVKEMQDLRPLHGEGMGNVFWPLCLPEDTAPSIASAPPALPFVVGTEEDDEEEYCDGGEVDYFDEGLGVAICEEEELPAVGQVIRIGIGTLVSGSVGYGMGFALAAAAAPEITRIVEE